MGAFSYGIQGFLIRLLVVSIIVFLIVPLHEFAHGWVAYKLGDPTAKLRGRLTLMPLAHVDIFGALMLLFVGFGWGKPVPIDSRNFKKPKLYTAITALAGPLSNIFAALIGGLILNVLIYFFKGYISSAFYSIIILFFDYYISINLGLAIFNLLPIPPLDGSKILALFIPNKVLNKILDKYYQYRLIVILIVFVLLMSNVLSMPLHFLQKLLFNWVIWLTHIPFSFF